jgi:hypothetical protein
MAAAPVRVAVMASMVAPLPLRISIVTSGGAMLGVMAMISRLKRGFSWAEACCVSERWVMVVGTYRECSGEEEDF